MLREACCFWLDCLLCRMLCARHRAARRPCHAHAAPLADEIVSLVDSINMLLASFVHIELLQACTEAAPLPSQQQSRPADPFSFQTRSVVAVVLIISTRTNIGTSTGGGVQGRCRALVVVLVVVAVVVVVGVVTVSVAHALEVGRGSGSGRGSGGGGGGGSGSGGSWS